MELTQRIKTLIDKTKPLRTAVLAAGIYVALSGLTGCGPSETYRQGDGRQPTYYEQATYDRNRQLIEQRTSWPTPKGW